MSDHTNKGTDGWSEDEGSGFYGEPDEWFNIDGEKSGDALFGKEPTGHTEPIRTFHENEPEEELVQWTGQIRSDAEADPFFDPDIPNISREERPSEEEPEEEPVPDKPEPNPSPKKSFKMPGKKILLFALVGAICAGAIFFIIYTITNNRKPKEEDVTPTETEEIIVTENTSVSTVRHISFPRLSLEDGKETVSVNEFSQILDSLYENGYVLVDVYSIAGRDENGNFTLSAELEVPEGKKPLIISQRDVPDTEGAEPGTYAEGLSVDDDGFIRSVVTDENGNAALGDLDLVPILETFLISHPDFSYDGARGVVALTGYGSLIGETDPEGVIAAMKARGWRFASNGYKGISYGSEYSLVEQDALSWNENVKALTGDTDLIILPRKTDISSWAPYSQNNPKFKLLNNLGFRYYFVHTPETPGFLQVESGYVKEAIWEIDNLDDYQNAVENGGI